MTETNILFYIEVYLRPESICIVPFSVWMGLALEPFVPIIFQDERMSRKSEIWNTE
jgi:hypothetical protein